MPVTGAPLARDHNRRNRLQKPVRMYGEVPPDYTGAKSRKLKVESRTDEENSARCETVRRTGEDVMKACILRMPAKIETNPLEFAEVAAPEPDEGQVLVRVRACGVCRTDLHVIEG